MRRKTKKHQRLKDKTDLQTNMNERSARYKRGLKEGYQQGLDAGYKSFESYFEGTSIIIPSYNEVEYVKQCIESIINHTDVPYEIIVVDNHSSDGIEHYLKQLNGFVRYHILSHNHGFAGAVNRGLMMAKGTSILLLSSHAVCTDNWLHNMLICLQSNSSIGMVGAVSNGMSGSQRMEPVYSSMEDVQEFATLNNQSDPVRWGHAKGLSRNCLLFRRELLEQIGFLDEGCQEEPYVEADYYIRVRLQGFSLMYAGDAFIYLTPVDEEITRSEADELEKEALLYFTRKWNKPDDDLYDMTYNQSLRQLDVSQSEGFHVRRLYESVFYPQAIAVKGLTETIFWIEDGVRRPIEGIWEGPVIQLSQMNLKQWMFGPVLNEEEALLKLNIVHGDGLGDILHGSVCVMADGGMYYMEKGLKRSIVSPYAAEAWCLNNRPQTGLSELELLHVPDGLPIIGPIHIRQAL